MKPSAAALLALAAVLVIGNARAYLVIDGVGQIRAERVGVVYALHEMIVPGDVATVGARASFDMRHTNVTPRVLNADDVTIDSRHWIPPFTSFCRIDGDAPSSPNGSLIVVVPLTACKTASRTTLLLADIRRRFAASLVIFERLSEHASVNTSSDSGSGDGDTVEVFMLRVIGDIEMPVEELPALRYLDDATFKLLERGALVTSAASQVDSIAVEATREFEDMRCVAAIECIVAPAVFAVAAAVALAILAYTVRKNLAFSHFSAVAAMAAVAAAFRVAGGGIDCYVTQVSPTAWMAVVSTRVSSAMVLAAYAYMAYLWTRFTLRLKLKSSWKNNNFFAVRVIFGVIFAIIAVVSALRTIDFALGQAASISLLAVQGVTALFIAIVMLVTSYANYAYARRKANTKKSGSVGRAKRPLALAVVSVVLVAAVFVISIIGPSIPVRCAELTFDVLLFASIAFALELFVAWLAVSGSAHGPLKLRSSVSAGSLNFTQSRDALSSGQVTPRSPRSPRGATELEVFRRVSGPNDDGRQNHHRVGFAAFDGSDEVAWDAALSDGDGDPGYDPADSTRRTQEVQSGTDGDAVSLHSLNIDGEMLGGDEIER